MNRSSTIYITLDKKLAHIKINSIIIYTLVSIGLLENTKGKTMKLKTLLGVSALSLIMAGCGNGGGGSSSENTNNPGSNNTGGNNTGSCISVGSLTISGISVVVADFDTNNDGCLSSAEMIAVNAYVAEQIESNSGPGGVDVASKTVAGVINNANTNVTKLISVTLIGNAESVDGVAQVHSNMADGEFKINIVKEDVRDEDFSFIRIITGDHGDFAAGEYTKYTEGYNLFSDNLMEVFYVDNEVNPLNSFSITCTYNISSEGACSIGDSVNDVEPINSNTPSGNTYIYVFLCSEKYPTTEPVENAGYSGCDNYAKIPVRFN